MDILEIVLTILFVIDCIALTVIVLLQEGKSGGLASLSGDSQSTYWSQNRGRSMEGTLAKITTGLAVLFFILAIVLNLGFFSA